ncbi:MAG: lytic transglycosylase domain-containing protein [Archangiaceae bacterium]|nr:lytic transglycosylase domain-containing protein [Archangiaceae bacterium]
MGLSLLVVAVLSYGTRATGEPMTTPMTEASTAVFSPPPEPYPSPEVPYDDPAIIAARKALDDNQPARALTALAALPPALHVRYLRAIASAKLGRSGPASEELELLSINYPALSDRCAYEAALLYEQRALPKKAIALLQQVSDRSWVFPNARLELAALLKAQRDASGASLALQPLLEWPLQRSVRSKVLLELAELARSRRDAKSEREALKLVAGLSAWWARQIGFRLGTPAVAMVARADQMLDHGACRSAEVLARKLAGQPDGLGCSARVIAAEAASCRGQDVTNDLKKIVKDCQQSDLAARALMTLGGAQAKQGKTEEAIASFRTVAKVAGPSVAAAEASFAAFWVGWKDKAAEASTEDLEAIEALPAGLLGAQDRARARYWRARVAEEHGDKLAAVGLLAEVAATHPATWYARLARQRLVEVDTEGAAKVTLASLLPSRDEPVNGVLPALLPGVEAMRLQLDGAASELVMLARKSSTEEGNREAIEVLQAAGETQVAHRYARAVLREQLGGEKHSLAVWRAAFPTPFLDAIGKHADDSSVPRGLLQGLVREESAFDPRARSHVGALGLTQLMPVTAKALARERGKPLVALSDLLDSDRNLELGAAYLGQMLRRFSNEPAIAAAAYNGGPTRVARWLKLHPCDRLEEWVEEIPIDETRNYVKDVLASADVYKGWPGSTTGATGQR